MSTTDLAKMLGDATYGFLALNFLWGVFCSIIITRRLKQLGFKDEEQQADFIEQVQDQLAAGDFESTEQLCEGDPRALVQLTHYTVQHRATEYPQLKQMVAERLQRDVLADLERRINWVATVIKCGPLLGLFGTVLGMMAAFGRIGTGEKVQPSQIADEISIALICTAMGLGTAIPLNYVLSAQNNRVRKLQEMVVSGIGRILSHFRSAVAAR